MNGMPLMDNNGFTQTQIVDGNTAVYRATLGTHQALGKLTYAPNASNRLTFTLIALPSSSGGGNTFGLDPRSGRPEVATDSAGGTLGSLGPPYRTIPTDTTLSSTAQTAPKTGTATPALRWA